MPNRYASWIESTWALNFEVMDLRTDRVYWESLHGLLDEASDLEAREGVTSWVESFYHRSQIMRIRRLVDRRRKVVSLMRLLTSMRQHSPELTLERHLQERFTRKHPSDEVLRDIEEWFRASWGEGGTVATPRMVSVLIDYLEQATSKTKLYADEVIAHNSESRTQPPRPSIDEVNAAVDAIYRVTYNTVFLLRGVDSRAELHTGEPFRDEMLVWMNPKDLPGDDEHS